MTVLSRSRFVTATLAAALAARGSADAQALTPIRAGSALNDEATPYLYAMQSGLFKRNGLDASVEPAASGAVAAAGVVGGSYDFGQSSVTSLCSAHARGVPLVLVAPAGLFVDSEDEYALVVRDDSAIKTPADLSGKTVTVSSLNDYFSLTIRAWVDAHGGDATTVKLVELPMTSSPAAVIAGRVDGAALTQPYLKRALDQKRFRALGNPGTAIGSRYLQSAWFTSRDFAAKNPDVVARFMRTMRDAQRYANTHHAETAPLLAAFTKVDPATVSIVRTPQGVTFDLSLVQPLIDIAARYKLIPARFDAREFIYPAALQS